MNATTKIDYRNIEGGMFLYSKIERKDEHEIRNYLKHESLETEAINDICLINQWYDELIKDY